MYCAIIFIPPNIVGTPINIQAVYGPYPTELGAKLAVVNFPQKWVHIAQLTYPEPLSSGGSEIA